MEHIIRHFPRDFNAYHEPFAGGLSVFLHLHASGVLEGKRVFLSDLLHSLMLLYQVVKNDVSRLIHELQGSYTSTPDCFTANKVLFNSLKESRDADPIKVAALFLYLNRTGFNGIYRENKKGEYNISFGKLQNPTICNEKVLRDLSVVLNGEAVSLDCCDYKRCEERMSTNDLVYIDPPYHGTFANYTKTSFGEDEQRALKYFVDRLTAKGCKVAVSNSDTVFMRELYSQYRIIEIYVKRTITCKGEDRKRVLKELLILNYD
jgi:DNA adenine methylase